MRLLAFLRHCELLSVTLLGVMLSLSCKRADQRPASKHRHARRRNPVPVIRCAYQLQSGVPHRGLRRAVRV
jgi:hypothetical protein